MSFAPLPYSYTQNNIIRHAGFELEMAHIDAASIAGIVKKVCGGTIHTIMPHVMEIRDTRFGTFIAELDARFFKDLAASAAQSGDSFITTPVDIMIKMAETVVPYELVTPPIPVNELDIVEILAGHLQATQAEGSKASWLYAFGLHINIEIARENVEYILSVLQAFILLYPWLKEKMDIDLTRQLTRFAAGFPDSYAQHILAPDYHPSLDTLINDYIAYNPTRNRALDCYPLFAHLVPDVTDRIKPEDAQLVKARPAFHYRLPNCEIDDPDWHISRDWNLWVEVEKLADNAELLSTLAKEYCRFLDKPLHLFSDAWLERIHTELDKVSLSYY